MDEELNRAWIRWGDSLVERFTKLSHNRLTKWSVRAILFAGTSCVLGLPLIKLKTYPNLGYWEAVLDYNQSNPWCFIVLIISIIVCGIIAIVNRIADSRGISPRKINKMNVKGSGNVIMQNSPNSSIIK